MCFTQPDGFVGSGLGLCCVCDGRGLVLRAGFGLDLVGQTLAGAVML